MTITILRGASGSGKSTYARSLKDTLIISRDIIRQSFGATGKTLLATAQEREVTNIEIDMLRRALVTGRDAVIDDTNLNPDFCGKLIDECHLYGVEPRFKFFDPPLEVLLERCKTSGVPEKVVRKQWSKEFPTPKVRVPLIEPISATAGLGYRPNAFIFDIDGTLAHIDPANPRDIYDGSRVEEDLLDPSLDMIASRLERENYLLVVSGRDEKYRNATARWLRSKEVSRDSLYMRPKGDTRHDAAVKYEIAQRIVEDYNVLGVFDDRSRVVQMWRTAGFKTFHVEDWIKSDF